MVTDVIFDCFGTLVLYEPELGTHNLPRTFAFCVAAGFEGTHDDFVRRWNANYDVLSHDSREFGREFGWSQMGGRFADLHLPALSAGVLEAFRRVFLTEWRERVGVRPHPGVRDVLDTLGTRFRLSVLSNTHNADMVADVLLLTERRHLFAQVVTSDEVGWRKPHPRAFGAAVDRLGIRPEDAVYVGDSFSDDYLGARASGIPCVLIDPPGRFRDVADTVPSLDRVPGAIARLAAGP